MESIHPDVDVDEASIPRDLATFPARYLDMFDKEFCIQQDFSASELGATCWDASFVLIKYFENEERFPPKSYWKGKSVLEIGAGTGACGIALGILSDLIEERHGRSSIEGFKVIITDRKPLLPLIRYNCKQNGLKPPRVQVLEHVWGQDIESLLLSNDGRPFDVILMSDIVAHTYSEYYPGLMESLRRLSDSNTSLILSYELRSIKDKLFFQMLLENGFSYRKVDNSQLDPTQRFVSEDIGIFEIKRTTS